MASTLLAHTWQGYSGSTACPKDGSNNQGWEPGVPTRCGYGTRSLKEYHNLVNGGPLERLYFHGFKLACDGTHTRLIIEAKGEVAVTPESSNRESAMSSQKGDIGVFIPGTRTVLIADDEPSIRDPLVKFLKARGYEPVVADDGQEALERASEQEFEIVFLDIGMPGLSGLDVLRQLNTDYPDTGVIMITAAYDVKTAVETMKLGAYDYVIKPFHLADILMRMEKARERRQLALQVKDFQKNLQERVAQQASQLREMTTQTVQALIQEEALARELEARGGKRKGLLEGADIKEFGAKILRRISGSQS